MGCEKWWVPDSCYKVWGWLWWCESVLCNFDRHGHGMVQHPYQYLTYPYILYPNALPIPIYYILFLFYGHTIKWSRLKPSYEFHFEGLSNYSSSVEGLVQIQDASARIYIAMNYKTLVQIVHDLDGNLHVFNTMWRNRNETSDSTPGSSLRKY